MKRKGYLFIEFIAVAGLFSIIILPLVMLMNKNINRLNYIKEDYEIRKLTENLESVFTKKLKEKGGADKTYYLIKDDTEKGVFILKEGPEKTVTKLRGIKISSDIKISLLKSKVFIEEDKIEKSFTEIFILEIKTKDKIIKKILPI